MGGALNKFPDPSNWHQLAKFTLVIILLLNKRRVSEVSELKPELKSYFDRPKWTEGNMEFEEAMTDMEQEFTKRYAYIYL